MTNIKSRKFLSISVTLICLMLVSAFAASGIVTVQASPEYEFTLCAVVTTDPFWGYYGGYHAIWDAIKPELEKIGINLEVKMYDAYTWWSIVWDSKWNVPGYDGGWDIFPCEWWLMPSAPSLWLESMVYSWLMPPEGGNIFPWRNEKADKLLWKGLHSFDAETRRKALWDWQELLMHDAPMINIYYGKVYEIESIWLEGYDPTAWFMEPSHMSLDLELQSEYVPESRVGTLIFGMGWEPIWGFSNIYMETYNEDRMDDLKDETLYDITIDDDNEVGYTPYTWPDTLPAPPDKYCVKPALAAELPTFMDGPYGPNTKARIPLRQGVRWSDGHPFNATDVKFTYETVLNLESMAVAYGDLLPVVESVEIVDEYTVDLILRAPSPDLGNVLSNEWGMAMIPHHILKDVRPADMRTDRTNTDWTHCLPALGPFMLNATHPDCEYVADDHVTLVKNPYYYGFDENIVGSPWGPYNIDKIILSWEPDPAVRLEKLRTHAIDFGEYCTAPIETLRDLEARQEELALRVYQYDYPASQPPLWLNLNGKYLANRYVRQAIAHAIPYKKIFTEILPSWGIEVYEPGKTFILPAHYYTDPTDTTKRVHLYNEELEPYEYNIAKAQQYMDMWKYSTDTVDWALGPVGDADQSGRVDFTDWGIWRASPLTGTWPDPDGLIYPTWPFTIDPDWDNDDDADGTDSDLWANNYGAEYPFTGAR